MNPHNIKVGDQEQISRALLTGDFSTDNDGSGKRARFTTVSKAEKYLIDRARKDPVAFIEYITGLPMAIHHRIWLANIFHPTRTRINIIAPRESAKTTITVYAMVWLIAKAPLRTHGIVSVSEDQAKKRLKMIRDTISDNVRFKNVFPWIHVDKRESDTTTEFSVYSDYDGINYSTWKSLIVRTKSQRDKNPTIFAAGSGGRGVIGNRISGLLLIDDIIDKDSLTELAQDKAMDYIGMTLEPCITEEGKMCVIGTRWMIADVPERLQNNPEWHTISIPAIVYDGLGTRHSYWPAFWPLDKLDKKKATMNNDALFNIMYMCDPQAMVMSYFTIEGINKDLPLPFDVELREIYISTDVAISLKEKADFNVAAAIGVDANKNVYLLDMIRFKAAVEDIVRLFGEFADSIAQRYGKLTTIIIEKVAFQAAIAQLLVSKRPDLPVVAIVPKGDKGHRASVVGTWMQRDKLFINQRMQHIKQLHSEWMNFDLHPHDDTLDAVSLAFQYMGMSIHDAKVKRIRSSVLL